MFTESAQLFGGSTEIKAALNPPPAFSDAKIERVNTARVISQVSTKREVHTFSFVTRLPYSLVTLAGQTMNHLW